jgi:hypothetical protein
MKIYNNFYLFMESTRIYTNFYNNLYYFLSISKITMILSVVSPTEVSEEPRRDDGGILGASREAAGSRGEMAVGDAGERLI